jgi:hypothetical protein
MRIEVYASDESLQFFYLAREQAEDETDRAAAIELIDATVGLCGDWILPLTASVRVESCAPANYYFDDLDSPPSRPSWFLRRRELDEQLYIVPAWINPQERRVETIGSQEIMSIVQEALAQPSPSDHLEVAFAELQINATAVVVPEGAEIALRYYRGPLQPLLRKDKERVIALGPDHGPVGPPAQLRASNQHGITHLELSLFWDLWKDHPAGQAQVRAAIERVLDRGRGWRLDKGELP